MSKVIDSSLLFAEMVRIEADHKATIIGTVGSALVLPTPEKTIRLSVFCRFMLEPTDRIPANWMSVRLIEQGQSDNDGREIIPRSDSHEPADIRREAWEQHLPIAANMIAELSSVSVKHGDTILATFGMGEETRSGRLSIVYAGSEKAE